MTNNLGGAMTTATRDVEMGPRWSRPRLLNRLGWREASTYTGTSGTIQPPRSIR